MSDPNDDVIRIARAWIGTPYCHQSSVLGAGADCLGLLRGVWRGVYGSEPEKIPAYTLDWSEPQGEERLWRAATRHLVEKPAGDAQPGDVLLFRMRAGSVAKHVGILTCQIELPSFVHAYSGHGVVESAFSRPWRRRVVASFSFPERP